VRVRYRHKESYRSLSHLMMSFLHTSEIAAQILSIEGMAQIEGKQYLAGTQIIVTTKSDNIRCCV